MEKTGKRSAEEQIRQLLGAYLASRETLKSSAAETSFHLDEDSLAVFAEGNMSQRESIPVVSHLVDCGFCRRKTAELVRLDLQFAGAGEAIRPATESEPSKISEVLGGLLAKIFGTTEGAVFAHNEKEDDDSDADKDGEESPKKE